VKENQIEPDAQIALAEEPRKMSRRERKALNDPAGLKHPQPENAVSKEEQEEIREQELARKKLMKAYATGD
jgi:hypothetical protein